MKEYDVFVPLRYNDGSPVEPVKLQILHARLLEFFNGVTFFPQATQGSWKVGDVTYHDEIVIYRVVGRRISAARRFLKQLKEELKVTLQQVDILIVERDVETL